MRAATIGLAFLVLGCGRAAVEQLVGAASPHRVASVERMNEGIAELERGEARRGRVALEEAVRIDPSHPDAWMNLGILHLQQGRLEDARHALEHATTLFGQPPPPLAFAYARVLLDLAADDPPERAELRRREALALLEGPGRDSGPAQLRAGVEHERRAELAAADAAYRRAIALQPGDVRAYVRLAGMYADQGFSAPAHEILVGVTQRFPEAVSGWIALGRADATDEDFEAAADAYARALEIDPASADAHFGLGMALDALDEEAGAAAELEAFLKAAPLDRPAHVAVAERRLAVLHLGTVDAPELPPPAASATSG